ncbi:MAG: hypothetical protein Q7S74_05880 [Nanoarchaeota archaeon]|nr:hypothetical protein [Nanoarchaeota archaeon]
MTKNTNIEIKKFTRRSIFGMLTLALALIVALQIVSADSYSLKCLVKGEQIDFGQLCNPDMPKKTGPTILCVHNQDNGKICSAQLNICNSLGITCSSSTGSNGTTIDITPPELVITSPQQNKIYPDRAILLTLNTNEESNILIFDKNNAGAGWKNVCSKCISYNIPRSFSEGKNEFLFKAIDKAGNAGYANVTFYVDSVAPKIISTGPVSGFASGDFSLSFNEASPKNITLYYGNTQIGLNKRVINIASECSLGTTSSTCNTHVNLSSYNGQQIEYWFEVFDIASSSAQSKHISLSVDISKPILNSLNYLIKGKDVTFTLNVNEPYLNSISYIDNLDSKSKETSLCKVLKNGICQKKVSFKDGNHNITIFIRDNAGATTTTSASFFTDSKPPKITSIDPQKGFASGLFEVQFIEGNPKNVTLTYSNGITGEKSKSLNLANDCTMLNSNKRSCKTDVGLSSYNGQQIEYWFEVDDRAGSIVYSKHAKLAVDTLAPVITSSNYTRVKNIAAFKFNITEQNFQSLTYLNDNDHSIIPKKLCTSLKKGACVGNVKLFSGINTITFEITDKAGNSIARDYVISL